MSESKGVWGWKGFRKMLQYWKTGFCEYYCCRRISHNRESIEEKPISGINCYCEKDLVSSWLYFQEDLLKTINHR